MDTVDELADSCRAHVGPVDVDAVRPRLDGGRVAFVRARDGRRFVVKQHGTDEGFARELRAYREWLPQLGEAVPQLVAAEPDRRRLLLTHVDGENATDVPADSLREELAHERAGAFLARLHRVVPSEVSRTFGAELAARLAARLPRLQTAAAITARERAALERYAERIGRLDAVEVGVCHLDFSPRNWLIRPYGAVVVVDFEHTKRDALTRDLCRLAHRSWRGRPHLRMAFFRGYRRRLTPNQEHQLALYAGLEAVTALSLGMDVGDPGMLQIGRRLIAEVTGNA